MHYFRLALRSLFRRGNGNIIKILCLAAGLALGLLLIAKVCFERSYNDFIADADRIYRMVESFDRGGSQGMVTFPSISGAVLPAMRDEIPQIETGTVMSEVGVQLLITENNDSLSMRAYAVDSLFLRTLSLPVVLGNDLTALSDINNIMISKSFADVLGGPEKAMGMAMQYAEIGGQLFTVTGIFEDFPENTHFCADMLFSINVMGERSLSNWYGNDRYQGYVKVHPGTDIDALEQEIRKVQGRHVDLEEMVRNNSDIRYGVSPLLSIHADEPEVKASNRMMLMLGIMLIVIAMLNYILLVVSTMVSRSRATAIEKCYGAGRREITLRTLAEVTVHLLLALAIAAGLVFVFRETVIRLMQVSFKALFAPTTLMILCGVLALIMIVAVWVPSAIYSNVPVAVAFRGAVGKKRWWKVTLLFVQFLGVSFLITVMATMVKQYDYIFKAEAGYSYDRLAVAYVGFDYQRRLALEQEARKNPAVEQVSFCSQKLWTRSSGNNAFLPGSDEVLVNFADLYSISDNYFDVLEIPVVEGEIFPPGRLNDKNIMVSRSFVESVDKLAGWSDGPIGKKLKFSEHSDTGDDLFTIVGVYEDFRIGTVDNQEQRPSVMFYDLNGNSYFPPNIMLIKLKDLSQDVISDLSKAMDCNVSSIYQEIEYQFVKERNLRDSLMICCLVALMIALAGLIGYTVDEINRRRREIAIRKVNGAETTDVVRVVSKDVAILSVPAIAIGVALGQMAGLHWLENFMQSSPLTIWQLLGIGTALFAIIIGIVAFRAAHASNFNPTEIINQND